MGLWRLHGLEVTRAAWCTAAKPDANRAPCHAAPCAHLGTHKLHPGCLASCDCRHAHHHHGPARGSMNGCMRGGGALRALHAVHAPCCRYIRTCLYVGWDAGTMHNLCHVTTTDCMHLGARYCCSCCSRSRRAGSAPAGAPPEWLPSGVLMLPTDHPARVCRLLLLHAPAAESPPHGQPLSCRGCPG